MNPPALPAGGSRRPLLVAVILAVVALAGLGAVAGRPGAAAWERGVFAAVNGLADAWWPALYVVMQVGSLAAVPVAACVALLSRRRRLAGQFAVAGIAAWLLARGLKWIVGRPRPVLLLPSVVLRGDETGGLGYPSGHVSVAMALAVVLAGWLPPRWRWLPWTLVATVGMARIYAGAHLPLDVVGGVLLGGLVATSVRASPRTSPPPPPERGCRGQARSWRKRPRRTSNRPSAVACAAGGCGAREVTIPAGAHAKGSERGSAEQHTGPRGRTGAP